MDSTTERNRHSGSITHPFPPLVQSTPIVALNYRRDLSSNGGNEVRYAITKRARPRKRKSTYSYALRDRDFLDRLFGAVSPPGKCSTGSISKCGSSNRTCW